MKTKLFAIKTVLACAVMLLVLSVSAFAFTHGDVSGDGSVKAEDARVVLRMAVGLDRFGSDTTEFKAADVNFDGKITADDARSVLRKAVGLEELLHNFTEYVAETKKVGSSDVRTGRHYQKCSSCGFENKEERFLCSYGKKVYEKDAKGNDKQPTCTEETSYSEMCSVCKGIRKVVVNRLGHSNQVVEGVSKPATCNEDGFVKYKCTRCQVESEKTLPKIEHPKHGSAKSFPVTCPICKKQVFTTINELINVLKTSRHTFTSFTKNYNSTKLTGTDIKVNPILGKGIEDELKKELSGSFMDVPETKYLRYKRNYGIRENTFPIFDSDTVSKLTDADIVGTPKVTKVNCIDFLDNLNPANISNGDIKNLVTKMKAKTGLDIYKVEVTVKTEKYTELKKNNIKESALMRIDGLSLVEYAETVPSLSDMGMSADDLKDMEGAIVDFNMEVTEATSKFNFVYYFDAQSNAPIAAAYTCVIDANEKISMNFSMDILGNGKTLWILKGAMNALITDENTTYYFFDDIVK